MPHCEPHIIWRPLQNIRDQADELSFNARPYDSLRRTLELPAEVCMDVFKDIGAPTITGATTALEYARGLLLVAAEVEHALLAQYLYTAGSIVDGPRFSASPYRKWAVWRQYRICCSWLAGRKLFIFCVISYAGTARKIPSPSRYRGWPRAPWRNSTITDVVLHIRYTARDGGAPFAGTVISSAKRQLNSMALAESRKGLYRMFSARHDYGSNWARFLNPGAGNDQVLTFDTAPERFPFLTGTMRVKVSGIDVLAKTTDASDYTLVIKRPAEPHMAMHVTPGSCARSLASNCSSCWMIGGRKP
jgi:hypothetical protein